MSTEGQAAEGNEANEANEGNEGNEVTAPPEEPPQDIKLQVPSEGNNPEATNVPTPAAAAPDPEPAVKPEEVNPEVVDGRDSQNRGFRGSRMGLSVDEDELLDDGPPKSFLKRYLGLSSNSFLMYLPKTVNIENRRINFVFFFLELVTIGLAIWFFVGPDQYSEPVKPDIQVTMCGRRCEISSEDMDALTDEAETAPYCTTPTSYTDGATTYGPFQCVRRCGRATNASACMLPSELVQVSREEAFIPTFYRQTYLKPLDGGTCPTGYSVAGSTCQHEQDFFVPGAEKLKVSFNHEFVVYPVYNSLSFRQRPSPMKAHSGAFHAEGWDVGMLTVLFSASGAEVKRFGQGEAVEFSVEEMLAAAYVSGAEELGLDVPFARAEAGVSSLPPRVTGLSITIDVWATSSNQCELHHTLQTEKTLKVQVDHLGPLTCISVHADRYLVTRTDEQPLGTGGDLRIDDSHGIRVRFRKSGSFRFLQEQALIRSFSALLLWVQFPVLITYWFCMLCLGTLSSIYASVVHQEVSVAEALKGFSARLLTYSSAFMDIRGRVRENSGSDGITKKGVAERVWKICEPLEMDDPIIERISHVIFNSLKSFKKENAPNKDVVTCQEFCAACSTNEPVQLGTLVKIFDKDRRLGLLERVFLDTTLAEVRRAALAGEAEGVEEEVPEDVEDVEVHATHSRVVKAYRDVQFMLKDLGRIEQLALKTAEDLDVNPANLGLVGTRVGGAMPAGSVMPKLKRSVSTDSIGNEASAEKRDHRDIER